MPTGRDRDDVMLESPLAVDIESAERLYQAAEEALRASMAAWGAAFDAAQAGGADRVRWMIEEAAWTANRRANAVRNIAWELADQVLSSSREHVRGQLLMQPAVPQPPAPPAPRPVQPTQQMSPQTVVRFPSDPAPTGASA
jgi:hypothetical protein